MYLKINPIWLKEKSKTTVPLFLKINQKYILLNHPGEIEAWTLKVLSTSSNVFIEAQLFESVFLSYYTDNINDFNQLCSQYELRVLNYLNQPSVANLEFINKLNNTISKNNFIDKSQLLNISNDLSFNIIKRTCLINHFKKNWGWLGGLEPDSDPELCSLLCDISLFDQCPEETHHLVSARKLKNFINQDIYLGVIHHRETPIQTGPFQLDIDRTHIYGQIISFCDNFLNSLFN